jgi:hypothetical protein
MFELVDRAKTDPYFQRLIYGVVNRQLPGQYKDYRRELEVVFEWVRKNVHYRRDPFGVELLQDVWRTLDLRRGDCDDMAILLSSAAEVLGAPSRFVTVSVRADKDPGHVYSQALVGGRWEAMDATVAHAVVGWDPPDVTDRRNWSRRDVGLAGEDESNVEGLGMNENGKYDAGVFETDVIPGVPNDAGHTWAKRHRGNLMIATRRIPSKEVSSRSEQAKDEHTGGGVYNPALPIMPQPTPDELHSVIDGGYLPPMPLDPDAWTGRPPDSVPDWGVLLPSRAVPEDQGMVDLQGMGAFTLPTSGISGAVASAGAGWAQQLMGALGIPLDQAVGLVGAYYAHRQDRRRPRPSIPPGAPPPPMIIENPPAEGMPSWLLPVGIGAAVLLVVLPMLTRK